MPATPTPILSDRAVKPITAAEEGEARAAGASGNSGAAGNGENNGGSGGGIGEGLNGLRDALQQVPLPLLSLRASSNIRLKPSLLESLLVWIREMFNVGLTGRENAVLEPL